MMVAQRMPTRTGLDAALSAVSPTVNSALAMSHERLADLGIPHVLIGGLAVGVHGHQYATQDVDWLVPRAAAFESTIAADGVEVVAYKPGVPVKVLGIGIEYVMSEGPPFVLAAMNSALAVSEATPKLIVIATAELLVWMKLKAGRLKDRSAVVELLRAGQIEDDAVRRFLVAAGDETVVARYDTAVQHAIEEG